MIPRVILHNGVSLDGRIEGFTVDVGLYYELSAHWHEDATLSGSDTLLNAPEVIPLEDEKVFEPRQSDPEDHRPLLVVPDSRGRIRTWHHWRTLPYWRDVVVLCSQTTPDDYLDYLTRRHIQYLIAGNDHVDLRAALEALNEKWGVRVVRLDSGGVLNGVLLREGLVDEVSLLVHPALVGGLSPRSFFRAPDLTSSAGVISLKLGSVETLRNEIIWLRYEVNRAS